MTKNTQSDSKAVDTSSPPDLNLVDVRNDRFVSSALVKNTIFSKSSSVILLLLRLCLMTQPKGNLFENGSGSDRLIGSVYAAKTFLYRGYPPPVEACDMGCLARYAAALVFLL